jgi:hypothetical protein
MNIIRSACGSGCVVLALAMSAAAMAVELNDYPTAARADYVYACMKANGETRQVLDQCSCSIDIIASILPYDRYVTAPCSVRPSRPGPRSMTCAGRKRKPRRGVFRTSLPVAV